MEHPNFRRFFLGCSSNAIPRRAHRERAQPRARKKFGLLEKHKVYVVRATAYHKKEQTLQKLKEKAAFRNPDEFYFKIVKTKTVDRVHRLESRANKYTPEELTLMKTQDIGYILQKVLTEKKKFEKLTATLHSLDNQPSNRHEAEEIASNASEHSNLAASADLPSIIRRKTAASYRELEARKSRMRDLEKLYMDMAMQKELQKTGRKRKFREDELVIPTAKPVYKWRQERKQ
ncbi:hypothetical protein K7X08_024434 [Anisodus acutangulus]|uniref:U3 small nucleolar RNA-associated protein 11 n=1 Tax=Anisodus acutangulus TaxID=402998 RepID=A0A9Q1M8C7_9SOLA|nr:hypothetical protein K7X08_024434 [Anisodus acutangulus]